MDQDRFLELLLKKKFNSATLEDIAELKEYLKSNDYNFTNDSELSKFPEFNIAVNNLSNEAMEAKWRNFSDKISTPDEIKEPVPLIKSTKFLNLKWLNLAAIFVIAIISVSFWFWNDRGGKSATAKQNIVDTKYGSKSKVQMPDGTVVWLNAGSKLTYDEGFGKSNRNINLIGEAFFDVKHDASSPFIIRTRNLRLKVLGTAFNVKAYPEDKTSEASLIRGSLEVSFPNRPTEKILLKPNEKIALVNNNNQLKQNKPDQNKTNAGLESEAETMPIIFLTKVNYIRSENIIKEVSWVSNKLIFRADKFEDIAREMERWYDIKIEFKNNNSSLRNKKFTGTFKNETFTEAFNALKETYNFKYTYKRETNTVTLTN